MAAVVRVDTLQINVNGHLQQCLDTVRKEFIIYNREKLKHQPEQGGQAPHTESRAHSQPHVKAQDGHTTNNNILVHGCTRGCSS